MITESIETKPTVAAADVNNRSQRPTRTYRTKEQWKALVAEFEDGDLTQSKYCKRHKIAGSGLYKWRKVFAEEYESNDFIDITEPLAAQPESLILSQPDKSSRQVELDLGGMDLRLRTS